MEFFQGIKPWKILPPTQVTPGKEFFLLRENEGKTSTVNFPQSQQCIHVWHGWPAAVFWFPLSHRLQGGCLLLSSLRITAL